MGRVLIFLVRKMPAPTALLRKPEELAEAASVPLPQEDDDELLLDAPAAEPTDLNLVQPAEGDTEMHIDEEGRPRFAPSKNADRVDRIETRKVPIPPHRMTPLKAVWPKMYPPLVEHLKLQVRMNIHSKSVELRSSKHTTDPGALQKGADFVQAFSLGFDIDDAIALLRLDDLYIQTFQIQDVSRTRIVLADSKIHLLGGFKNIQIAKTAVVSLILGSPPGKVYGNLRTVAARMKERF